MKRHILILIACLLSIQFSNAIEINVLSEGVVSDSALVQTSIIQQLIDKCAKAGGGKIVFPPGAYKTGGLILKSNIRFHLEAGATLIASRDTNDYKKSQNNSGDIIPVLLYAKNARNISLEGLGTIDGSATHYWANLDMVDGFIADITENAKKAGVPMQRYFHYKPYTCMIYFENCAYVTVRDLTLTASQFWTLHARWTDYMTITGLKVFSDMEKGINADGIDIDGCRNVTISDCIVETADDAIVLKTTGGHSGEISGSNPTNNLNGHKTVGLTNGARSCENITITNCVLRSSSTALKIGTESHADFRYINFNNCVIRDSNRGLSIVIRDGATAENIQFSNIVMECTRRHFNWWGNADPIWLVVLKRRPDSKVGRIRNVTFSNIIAHGMGTSKLEGFEGKPLENIRLNNVQFFMHPENYIDKRADDAFRATNVNDLHLTDVCIKWDKEITEPLWRNAFTFEKVNGLVLDKLSGEEAPTKKGAFIELQNTDNVLINNCIAGMDSNVFLKYIPKLNKRVIIGKNMRVGKSKLIILKK